MSNWKTFFGLTAIGLLLVSFYFDTEFFRSTPALKRIVCTTSTGPMISEWVPYADIHRIGGGAAYDKKGYHFMLWDTSSTCEIEMQ